MVMCVAVCEERLKTRMVEWRWYAGGGDEDAISNNRDFFAVSTVCCCHGQWMHGMIFVGLDDGTNGHTAR